MSHDTKGTLHFLPDERMQAFSEHNYFDYFYALPKNVECFIDRANQELKAAGLKTHVRPRTLYHHISVFFPDGSMGFYCYEWLDDVGVVALLEVVMGEAKKAEYPHYLTNAG